MLVYMLGLIQADAEFHGVRATAETIADLLVESLAASGEVRATVPKALSALEEAGAVMQLDNVWRLQTKEAAEWDAAYRTELRSIRANPTEVGSRRRAALEAALSDIIEGPCVLSRKGRYSSGSAQTDPHRPQGQAAVGGAGRAGLQWMG